MTSALDAKGSPTGWTAAFNEATTGDLRATYPGHDMYQERVGDYVYAAASNGYGVGVWASAINASVCNAVQTGAPAPLRPSKGCSRRHGH
jgi:hypothetical protein